MSIIVCFIHINMIKRTAKPPLHCRSLIAAHERHQPLTDSVAARGGVLRQQGERRRPKRSGFGGIGSEEAEGNVVATGEAEVEAQRSWYQ